MKPLSSSVGSIRSPVAKNLMRSFLYIRCVRDFVKCHYEDQIEAQEPKFIGESKFWLATVDPQKLTVNMHIRPL